MGAPQLMVFPKTTWRLITSPAAHGAWNMAVDEAILESTSRGDAPPTLRLYAWEPPCLSLGYAQPISEVDRQNLARSGWHLVRRPTGGRAILHTDELTYAVIGPNTEPRLSGSILESYKRLSKALLRAINLLQVSAQASEIDPPIRSEDKPLNPVCFEVPSAYEITVNGKKLIGSAQARRKNGVLQHGSLPLHGDLTRITHVLRFDDEESRSMAASRLISRALTVESALGHIVDWETAAQAFVFAFEETLNIEFQPAELSPSEKARASSLVKEKYDHPSWAERI